MIGHYVDRLTTAQEDAVLTQEMKPGWYLKHEVEGPCLRGVAEGASVVVSAGLAFANQFRGLTQWDRPFTGPQVEGWYDKLCERFGTSRTNAAIRTRILRNRAWRALHSGTVSGRFVGKLSNITEVERV